MRKLIVSIVLILSLMAAFARAEGPEQVSVCTINGVIVDQFGHPVDGAKIRVLRVKSPNSAVIVRAGQLITTLANGAYSFPAVIGADYWLKSEFEPFRDDGGVKVHIPDAATATIMMIATDINMSQQVPVAVPNLTIQVNGAVVATNVNTVDFSSAFSVTFPTPGRVAIDSTGGGGGGAGVTSFNTRVGAVVASGGDYSFSQIGGSIALGQIPDALITNAKLAAGIANSFNGRSGVVSPQANDYAVADINGLPAALAGKSATSHTHVLSQVTDAGSAASKNAPASGDALSGEVVLGNDSRLSDARTPTTHTHTVSQITDFDSAVDARIPVTTVFGRAGIVTAASGDYTWGQIDKATSSLADITTRLYSDLQSIPSTFAPAAHNQAWSTITATPTTLAGYGIGDAVSGSLTSGTIPVASGSAALSDSPITVNSGNIRIPATAALGHGGDPNADLSGFTAKRHQYATKTFSLSAGDTTRYLLGSAYEYTINNSGQPDEIYGVFGASYSTNVVDSFAYDTVIGSANYVNQTGPANVLYGLIASQHYATLNNAAASSPYIYGMDAAAWAVNGTGTINELVGARGYTVTSTGAPSVTDAFALFGEVDVNHGGMTRGSTLYGKMTIRAGAGVTELRGVDLSNWTKALGAVVGTATAIYIGSDTTIGTTNYAIHSLSSAQSSLAGDLTVSGLLKLGTSPTTINNAAGKIFGAALVGTDIDTVGTVSAGTWQATPIADPYIASAATWNAAVPNTRTVNGHALSSNVAVTPADLSLVIGTNVQAWDADLDTWATKTPYAGTLTITTGKTAAFSNSITISGTDNSTLDVGAGGTLGSNAFTSTAFVPTSTTVNSKALSGNITLGLASSDFANQGATTTILHGNAAGNPSFGQVVNADVSSSAAIAYSKLNLAGAVLNTDLAGSIDLTTKVTGDLPFANFVPATAASKLVGRGSASGAGDFEEITVGSGLTMTGTTLSASGGGTPANPTASVGLSAVNGSLSTYMRSDAAPALDQSITPTWTGPHTFAVTARSSGVASYFALTTPADTAQTASTESIGMKLGGNSSAVTVTRQWATGALTTQREVAFVAPTYAFVGASTITDAATVDITAAPVAGTNATITNPWALRIESGNMQMPTNSRIAFGPSGNDKPFIEAFSDSGTGSIRIGQAQGQAAGGLVIGRLKLTNGSSPYGYLDPAGGRFDLASGVLFGWSSSSNNAVDNSKDLILNRRAAATLNFGGADAAAPVAQNFTVQGVVAGTSNTAGTDWTFKGSQGTGTGAGGSLIFQIAPAGSTGTSQNALATALTIDSTKLVTMAGWMQWTGEAYLASNATSTSATLANITGLTINNLIAGHKYGFKCILHINNSVAADGVKIDFGGGSASATTFRAQVEGNDTAIGTINTSITSLTGAASAATFTGDGAVIIEGSITVNAAGTFIPRFAVNNHTTGTLTAYIGSNLLMWEMP